jgi:hypothetical protein
MATDKLSAEALSDSRLNATLLFSDTDANIQAKVVGYPVDCQFLATDTGIIYKNTGNSTTATWTATAGVVNTDTEVYPLDVTIGDYSIPNAVTGVSSTSSIPLPSPDVSYDYSSSTGWTQTGSQVAIGSNVLTGTITTGSLQQEYKALGITLSDSQWICDFKYMTTFRSSAPSVPVLVFAAGTSDPQASTQDSLMVIGQNNNPGDCLLLAYKDGAGSLTTSGATQVGINQSQQYYCRLSRTSTTNLRLSVYSDVIHQTLVGTIDFTIPSTVTTLTTIQHCGDSTFTSGRNLTYIIDDTWIWNNTTTGGVYSSSANLKDTNTTTAWTSNSEVAPYCVLDYGSSVEIAEVAIYFNKATTTATQIKIQTSLDNVTYTDKRLINVSAFNGSAWDYIRFNRDIAQNRYVKILGTDAGSKILSIYEVKILSPSETLWNRRHGHKTLSASNANLAINA